MPAIKTINYIRKEIEAEGFELISNTYETCMKPIEVRCPNGHIYKTTWNKFKTGRRCNICSKSKKKTINEVRKYIESFGYSLVSDIYKNCYSVLTLSCPNNHIYETSWDKFKIGYRCKFCRGKYKKSFHYIKDNIEKFGYIVLTKEIDYINTGTIIMAECPEGHSCKIRWNDFRRGIRCSACRGLRKKSYNFIKIEIEKLGFKLISKEYINSETKLEVLCGKGHTFYPTWHNLKYGSGCPICSKSNISKASQEWLNSLGIPNECREIGVKTVDGYNYIVDALVDNIVYEYFGRFWHGHPHYYNENDVNPITNTTFGYLYVKTLNKIERLSISGYKVVYKWGP